MSDKKTPCPRCKTPMLRGEYPTTKGTIVHNEVCPRCYYTKGDGEMPKETVELPKEVAEAIESVRKDYGDEADEKILTVAFDPSDRWVGGLSVALNEFDRSTLIRALVNGYTVKRTAAERLREYYERYCGHTKRSNELAAHAIKKTIEILADEYPELVGVLGEGGDGE